ncbi:tyrosine-type recombinase/integrase [Lactococcus lactis]|uniref:tyrosine-type recombinase/integrase n=1 Tax=Lactococcus lactis TaxID=1358 RepID=UPI001F58C97A|nr:site-specific integrase [Lactococcus lactis]
MWIENLPNGKFKYTERYKDSLNKTRKVSITLDKNTARAKNEAQRILFDKINQKSNEYITTNKTFWEVKNEWLTVANKTLKSATVRSKVTAFKLLKNYIPEDIKISALNKIFIRNTLEDIYYNRNLSYAYMQIVKSSLSSIFEFAINKGYIKINPSKNISIQKKKQTIEERNRKNEKYLERDELKEVISLANAINKRLGMLIEFLALTGLRQGEAVALQIKNIKNDKIEVVGTYERYDHEKVSPKNTSSERIISLPKRAIKILQEIISQNIKEGRTDNNPDNYIFVTNSGLPLSYSAIDKVLKQIHYKKNLSTHVFRHTHIALLTELGIPLKAIMDRVGHSNPTTTLSIYSHVTQKLSDQVIEKLNTVEL